MPACGAPLDNLLQMFPLLEVIRRVMTGGGECGAIDWTFLGLSMPDWVLIMAVTLGLAGIVNNAPESRAPELSVADLGAFAITRKWPARHPDRIQLYSLPTPNGVKVSIMLEETGLAVRAAPRGLRPQRPDVAGIPVAEP